MKFSVIYSVDIPKPEPFSRGHYAPIRLNAVKPPQKRLWTRTEKSNSMGADEGMTHGKWVAILDRKQFEEFVSHCGLVADSVETMGSLGAPGFGIGWAPAISFNTYGEGYWGNAYVTPLPAKRNGEPIRANGATERDWERVKAAVVRVFGS